MNILKIREWVLLILLVMQGNDVWAAVVGSIAPAPPIPVVCASVMANGSGADLCAPFIAMSSANTALNMATTLINTGITAGATTATATSSGFIAGSTAATAISTSDTAMNTGYIAGDTLQIAMNTSAKNARDTAKDANDKLNWLQTLDAYAKEALQLQEITIQTELLVKDIEENPLQVIVPDVNQLLANQAQINTIAQQIDSGSGAMSQNLMNNLQHPASIGLGQGTTFELWSEARAKAVDEALTTAKFLASDAKGQNASFMQLVKNISSAQGPSMAAKNAAEAGKQQVQIAQKMLEAINQLLMLQTTEQGAKVAADMSSTNDSVSANAKLWGTDPLGHPTIAHDTYQGPGISGQGKAF